MAAAMKFFFVLVAIVCCLQLVEMHRLRRDEPVETPDITKTLEALMGQIKDNIEKSPVFKDIAEKIQNIKPEDAAHLLEKVSATVKENLGNAESFVKETLEKINTETKTEH